MDGEEVHDPHPEYHNENSQSNNCNTLTIYRVYVCVCIYFSTRCMFNVSREPRLGMGTEDMVLTLVSAASNESSSEDDTHL